MYHVLYDSHCGLCQAVHRLLQVMETREAVAFVPIDDPAVRERFARIPPERLASQLHVVGPDGRISGGYEAVVALLGLMPALGPLHALLRRPGMARHGRRLYGWVARNRYRLFGRMDDGRDGRR